MPDNDQSYLNQTCCDTSPPPSVGSDNFFVTMLSIALAFCCGVVLWTIWSPSYFVLQDLPDHMARAAIIKGYFSSDVFRHYFAIPRFPTPYTLPDLLSVVLLSVSSAPIAAKAFATAAAAAYIAGAWSFVRTMVPKQPELLLFPLVALFSNVFIKGNLNFFFGLGFLLWLIGYWWPHRTGASRGRSIVLAVGLLILYGLHLICLLAFFLAFGVDFLRRSLQSRVIAWKSLAPLAPSLVLIALYFFWDGAGATVNPDDLRIRGSAPLSMNNVIAKYGSFKLLFGVSSPYIWLGVLPAFGLYAAFAFIAARREKSRDTLAVFLVFLGCYLILPAELPSIVRPEERLFLITVLFGLCIIRTERPFPEWARTLWIIVMTLTCMLQGNRLRESEIKMTPYVADQEKAISVIPRNSLVCPIRIVKIAHLQHYYKFATVENNAVTPAIFTSKHIALRYRTQLPLPPNPPGITPELLAVYDYFLVYGDTPAIRAMVANGTLQEMWSNKKWLSVLRNTTVGR